MTAFLIPSNLAPLCKIAPKNGKARYAATSGVRLSRSGETYKAESTDGRRAIQVSGPCPHPYQDFLEVPAVTTAPNGALSAIVPADELVRISKEVPKQFDKPAHGCIAVALGEKITTLCSADVESASIRQPRNVEGVFPNIDKVLPAEPPTATINVDADLLAELVGIASHYTEADTCNRITLDIVQGMLRVTTSNGEQKFVGVLVPLKK